MFSFHHVMTMRRNDCCGTCNAPFIAVDECISRMNKYEHIHRSRMTARRVIHLPKRLCYWCYCYFFWFFTSTVFRLSRCRHHCTKKKMNKWIIINELELILECCYCYTVESRLPIITFDLPSHSLIYVIFICFWSFEDEKTYSV